LILKGNLEETKNLYEKVLENLKAPTD